MIFRNDIIGEGYQRLDYIQGTGAQSITVPDNLDCDYFEFQAQYLDTSAEMCIVGNYASGGTYRWEIFCSSGRKFYSICTGYNSQGTTQGTVSALEKATISYDYSTHKMNVNNIDSLTKNIGTCQPKYLFQYGNNGLYAKAKMFYFLEKKNDEIVLNLVPVKRISDDKVGMYDTITKTFYPSTTATAFTGGNNIQVKLKASILPNVGSGSFTAGNNISVYANLKPRMAGYKGYPGFDFINYKKVEYLANSNGVQFLDIPFIPDASKGFRFEFGFNPTAIGKRYALMSNYNTGSYQLSLELSADNKMGFWLNNGSSNTFSSNTFTANTLNEGVFEFSNNVWKIILNGTTNSGNYAFSGKSTATSMYAFLDRAKRTSTFPAPIKFYYIRIYEQGELKFNLIPCKRKSDDVYGMYDIINKTFYHNLGTGAFTIGTEQNIEIW